MLRLRWHRPVSPRARDLRLELSGSVACLTAEDSCPHRRSLIVARIFTGTKLALETPTASR